MVSEFYIRPDSSPDDLPCECFMMEIISVQHLDMANVSRNSFQALDVLCLFVAINACIYT